MRMMRGSELGGLSGPGPRDARSAAPDGRKVRVAAPAPPHAPRGGPRAARRAGLDWREDSSNLSPRFTRNRVRGGLLPRSRTTCGPEGLAEPAPLRRRGRGPRVRARAAHRAPRLGEPRRRGRPRALERALRRRRSPRRALTELAPPLQRRALCAPLDRGHGRDARRARCSTACQQDLDPRHGHAHDARRALDAPAARRRGPASRRPCPTATHARGRPRGGDRASPRRRRSCAARASLLGVPGTVRLPDGRTLTAELARRSPPAPTCRAAATRSTSTPATPRALLRVRYPQPGRPLPRARRAGQAPARALPRRRRRPARGARARPARVAG